MRLNLEDMTALLPSGSSSTAPTTTATVPASASMHDAKSVSVTTPTSRHFETEETGGAKAGIVEVERIETLRN